MDVRVVAATNKLPEEAVSGGHLREDLFYRLNVFHIHLPPLRERKEDIPAMAEALIADMNRKHDCKVTEISPEVLECLQRHQLAGQCARTAQRAGARGDSGGRRHHRGEEPAGVPAKPAGHGAGCQRWRAAAPAPAVPVADDPDAVKFQIGTTVEEAEKGLILRTLEHTRNNKTRAAEILGISLKTLAQ